MGALGIILGICVCFVDNYAALSTNLPGLARGSYGMEAEKRTVLVEGFSERPRKLEVEVSAREFTAETAEEAFARAEAEILQVLPGSNPSLNEVRTDLNLPSAADEERVFIRWFPEDENLVSGDGRVFSEEVPESGRLTVLTAELSAGEFRKTCTFPVTVYPPVLSGEEKRFARFLRYLGELDKETRTGETLPLPEEFENRKVRFREEISWDFLFFFFAGIGSAVLLPYLEEQRREEQKKKEEKSLQAEYPELLSGLVVYLGAGLPVRGAMERLAGDYEQSLARGGERKLAAEELAAACHRMQRGMPEREAYLDFGRRCRVLCYRRLSGILSQNLRNGSESLLKLLGEEMTAAFAERRSTARRAAEEAQTKLCLPLVMMLAAVMMMVTVPAFLSL